VNETTTIHCVSLVLRTVLDLWGVGYDTFVVGPNGILVEWCRNGLLADVYCVLGESKEDAKAAWGTATARAGSTKLTPDVAEALIFDAHALAVEKGLLPRVGYPPLPCECGRVGEPTIAMTTLGDGSEQVGAWCRGCRHRLAFLPLDDLAIPLLPPGRWLAYDRLMPEPGEKWPERKEDPAAAFPFGANVQ